MRLAPAALANLCAEVQTISLRVGEFIREERTEVQHSDIDEKSFNNLVSYVDKQAEAQFVQALTALIPEAGFITEEDETRTRGERYNWVIDPLDGTTNYLHGVPCFATSVALLEDNVPVLGVIYEINLRECFYAWAGGGAWCNGSRIRVSRTPELKSALLGTGFPYSDHGMLKPYLALFADLMQCTRGLRRPGSAATDLAYVACGRYDAFYEYGLHAWDVAAGIVLVQEAGGVVSDFAGGDTSLFRQRIIAGTPGVHAELLRKIQHHFPPEH